MPTWNTTSHSIRGHREPRTASHLLAGTYQPCECARSILAGGLRSISIREPQLEAGRPHDPDPGAVRDRAHGSYGLIPWANIASRPQKIIDSTHERAMVCIHQWGSIMPMFLASYDLKETNPDPHAIFLKQATTQGWKLWVLGGTNVWYRLPNTTLDGTFANMAAAESALEATRAATEKEMNRAVTMNKWIIAEYGSARFNSDERRNG